MAVLGAPGLQQAGMPGGLGRAHAGLVFQCQAKPQKTSQPVLSLESDNTPPDLQPDIPYKAVMDLTCLESGVEHPTAGLAMATF